ncbi:hypothetical protein HMPREF0201_00914 [Cedecea davisae DSM 4568]|uniref:Uncharacterized protein n=1 Tax=Cedecea davisae DSM 4568 TaxID=566551 RepID=S3J1Y7_9ENTR|nr:hypothetical protein HMPREF0201_00914 [Cedecea davisae DSM 4568]
MSGLKNSRNRRIIQTIAPILIAANLNRFINTQIANQMKSN